MGKATTSFTKHHILALAVAQAIIGLSASQAASITVDNPTDVSDPGSCTLRDAIASANTDAAVAGCGAGNMDDTITFDASVLPGIITLDGTQLDISTPIAIEGPGANQLTIDADGMSRLMVVTDGDDMTKLAVSVSGLTLTGGQTDMNGTGGAIANDEHLTVDRSVVTGNTAFQGGGISNIRGTLVVTNSTIADNQATGPGVSVYYGGGMFSYFGVTTVTDSTLSGNTAKFRGGAMAVSGLTTIENSTISGNSAMDGGGIGTQLTNTAIINSTISGNSAGNRGGGIANKNGSVSLRNSTLSENSAASSGGGLYSYSDFLPTTASLTNSIVANSVAGGDCTNGAMLASIESQNSLIEDGLTCVTADSYSITGDPSLGPLGDNGGSTLTHLPGAESTVINAGNNGSCEPTDQRGESRSDGLCDIGSVEQQPADLPPVLVNTIDATVADEGFCSLPEAVTTINTGADSGALAGECEASGSQTIRFDPMLVLPATITLGGTELAIQAPMIIEGPGPDSLTISGEQTSRVFNVYDNNTTSLVQVVMSGLTIADGSVPFGGGGIYNREDLTLDNMVIADNRGGGVNSFGDFALNARLNVTDTTISGSTGGSGLALANTNATVNRSTISGNDGTPYSTGGIGVLGGNTDLVNATVSGNTGATAGGLSNQSGAVSLEHSTIANNTAVGGNYGAAGGVYSMGGGGLDLVSSIIDGNVFVAPSAKGSAAFADDCASQTTPINSNSDMFIGDGTCLPAESGDSGLDALADNGGPTQTHGIRPNENSPLIDAATCIGLDLDQTGMPRPIDGNADGMSECDIGAFEFVDVFGPAPFLSDQTNVTSAQSTHSFVVVYLDDAPLDGASLDATDVSVTGPETLTVAFVGLQFARATYEVTPPNGVAWQAADNGKTYTIAVNANEVFDLPATGSNAALAGPIGTFSVNFADIDVLGQAMSIANGDSTPDVVDDTDFGNVAIGQMAVRTFTITNTTDGTINLNGPIAVSGAGFSTTQPILTSIDAGISTTFDVTFDPTSEGMVDGLVTINSDDIDESEYTFAITANGINANTPPVVDDQSFGVLFNAPANTVVGQVVVMDAEGLPGSGGFAITSGNAAGDFALDDNGNLTILVAAESLASDPSVLDIMVTDTGGLMDSAQVTVRVLQDVVFNDGGFEEQSN